MNRIIINGLMLLIGCGLIFSGARRIYVYSVFKTLGISVTGSVDKASAGADFGGRPLIRYKDNAGGIHILKTRVKTHLIWAPQPGEKIQVMFLKKDAGTAVVDSRLHYLFLPLLLILLGAAMGIRVFTDPKIKG